MYWIYSCIFFVVCLLLLISKHKLFVAQIFRLLFNFLFPTIYDQLKLIITSESIMDSGEPICYFIFLVFYQ